LDFSAAAAACEGPVVKSIPYVLQPEQIIPGADYYATSVLMVLILQTYLLKNVRVVHQN
jgi:hypothetical protein